MLGGPQLDAKLMIRTNRCWYCLTDGRRVALHFLWTVHVLVSAERAELDFATARQKCDAKR